MPMIRTARPNNPSGIAIRVPCDLFRRHRLARYAHGPGFSLHRPRQTHLGPAEKPSAELKIVQAGPADALANSDIRYSARPIVNEGLTIYFLCGLESQKAENLARDNRVSLTIDHDTANIMAITGLSLAARAYPVTDRAEAEKVLRVLRCSIRSSPNRCPQRCRNPEMSAFSASCRR
jgi:hypothetical protein